MSRRRQAKTTDRGYGWSYQQARKSILANNPPCFWGCGRPATTADHYPPMVEVGAPHSQLVPACAKCNYGHRSASAKRTPLRTSRRWNQRWS